MGCTSVAGATSGWSARTTERLVRPVAAQPRQPCRDDRDDREAAESPADDGERGARERGDEAGLRRAELVRRADEDHVDGAHAAAERVGRRELDRRVAQDDADLI